MTHTTRPAGGRERRAWTVFSVIMGPIKELESVQEHLGNSDGFWRIRFQDRDSGEILSAIIPDRNLDNVHDAQIAAIQKAQKKGESFSATPKP